MNKAYIDTKNCTGCGECVPACPRGCIAIIDGKAVINEEDCVGYMACAAVCPEDAIILTVETQIIPNQEQTQGEIISVSPNAIETSGTGSTIVKIGKFLVHSAIALLSSPRVVNAIFGESDGKGSKKVTGNGKGAGRGLGRGRGRGRGAGGRKNR